MCLVASPIRKLAAVLFLVIAVAGCTTDGGDEPNLESEASWGEVFEEEGLEGTFAVREVGSAETTAFNPDRAAESFVPASTFKILNSLVILEEAAVSDVDEVVPWDQVDRPVAAWNQDHSLRTGIEVSAVWMYQELARRVGVEAMTEHVESAGYGNAQVGSAVDRFWLDGPLEISALEQLDFLERMIVGDLPFAPETLTSVREILVQEWGPGWSWSYKTGTSFGSKPQLGWLVGIAENEGSEWVFAMNLDLERQADAASQIDPRTRQRIAREILASIGALPDEAS